MALDPDRARAGRPAVSLAVREAFRHRLNYPTPNPSPQLARCCVVRGQQVFHRYPRANIAHSGLLVFVEAFSVYGCEVHGQRKWPLGMAFAQRPYLNSVPADYRRKLQRKTTVAAACRQHNRDWWRSMRAKTSAQPQRNVAHRSAVC